MATITKAALETQIEELQAALAAAEQRAADLQQQIEATEPSEERRDQLEQIVWLQREAPSFERKTLRWAANGETLLMRVACQYSSVDRRTGERLYGERRWFTAIGETAEELKNLMETSDTRLVRIGAYERPQQPAEDGTRRSEWVLSRFTPMPRLDRPATPVQAGATAPATAPAAPVYQPTLEEIPF